MVQFFETTPTPNWSSRLGEAIGQGLSVGAQNRLAEQQRMREHHRNQQALMAQEQRNEQFQISKENRAHQYEQQMSEMQRQQQLQERQQELSALQQVFSQSDDPQSQLLALLKSPVSNELKRVGAAAIINQQKASRPNAGTQADRPVDPDQLRRIEEVRRSPGFNELDEVGQYQAFTENGVSSANASAESKLQSEKLKRLQGAEELAYKTQQPFIDEVTNHNRAFQTETKPRLLQMRSLESDDKLISPTSAAFLDLMGIPLGALENPASELYDKLSKDLLKGLPETYGNKIMKVEVDNFLKTIPSLLNSPNGRRMIASNMLKLGEMKEVYYNEMRRQQTQALDSGKPLPRDFQQRVFDGVKPQIDRINEEFVKMSAITDVPEGTIPYFDPSGNVVFVENENEAWAQQRGGKRIW